ncbi:MAG: Fic family protein [Candidatus Woesearchaeota archaeon]
MVYIRTRKKGKYIYKELVETKYVDGKPVQKFIKHIGKVEISKIKPNLTEKDIKNIDKIKRQYNKNYKKLPKTAKEKFLVNFLTKFTYNTNKIEGSTLSLRDTSLILNDKIAPKGALMKEVKEVENHKKAFDYMYNYKDELSEGFILELHKILMNGIDDEIAGKIRDFNVKIHGTLFKPPIFEEIKFELKNFLYWYEEAKKKKLHMFEIASLVHLKFVTIHPFGDGNGRISRLLQNFILKKHNYPMLNIPYKNREMYYDNLEECQINKIEKPFVNYLLGEYFREYNN